MFSLLDQVVLRLLPVRHPEQLVIVRETGNHYGNTYGANTISWPMFEDLRDNNQVFSGMFCRFPATVTIGYGDRTAQIPAELVSGSYFPILGVGAALGRTIAPDDDAVPDSQPVVVLSYSFWRSYFDGDRTIVGRTIALNSHAMTVIGVAQPGFDGVETGSSCEGFRSHHDEDGDDAALGRPQGSAPPAELGHRVRAPQARRQALQQASYRFSRCLHSILEMEVAAA